MAALTTVITTGSSKPEQSGSEAAEREQQERLRSLRYKGRRIACCASHELTSLELSDATGATARQIQLRAEAGEIGELLNHVRVFQPVDALALAVEIDANRRLGVNTFEYRTLRGARKMAQDWWPYRRAMRYAYFLAARSGWTEAAYSQSQAIYRAAEVREAVVLVDMPHMWRTVNSFLDRWGARL